jgi:hypothetical protein
MNFYSQISADTYAKLLASLITLTSALIAASPKIKGKIKLETALAWGYLLSFAIGSILFVLLSLPKIATPFYLLGAALFSVQFTRGQNPPSRTEILTLVSIYASVVMLLVFRIAEGLMGNINAIVNMLEKLTR